MKGLRAASLVALGGCLAVTVACAGGMMQERSRTDIPTSTRTGNIIDVKIAEALAPQEVQVRRGDEVRWVNMRTDSVKLVFTDPLREKVSCQNKFTGKAGWMDRSPDSEYQTQIKSNDSVSLCFKEPGTYTYVARMESALPGGEKNERGTIRVDE